MQRNSRVDGGGTWHAAFAAAGILIYAPRTSILLHLPGAGYRIRFPLYCVSLLHLALCYFIAPPVNIRIFVVTKTDWRRARSSAPAYNAQTARMRSTSLARRMPRDVASAKRARTTVFGGWTAFA